MPCMVADFDSPKLSVAEISVMLMLHHPPIPCISIKEGFKMQAFRLNVRDCMELHKADMRISRASSHDAMQMPNL